LCLRLRGNTEWLTPFSESGLEPDSPKLWPPLKISQVRRAPAVRRTEPWDQRPGPGQDDDPLMAFALRTLGVNVHPDLFHPRDLGQPIDVPVAGFLFSEMSQDPHGKPASSAPCVNVIPRGVALQGELTGSKPSSPR
jgi:hypothetical protein